MCEMIRTKYILVQYVAFDDKITACTSYSPWRPSIKAAALYLVRAASHLIFSRAHMLFSYREDGRVAAQVAPRLRCARGIAATCVLLVAFFSHRACMNGPIASISVPH